MFALAMMAAFAGQDPDFTPTLADLDAFPGEAWARQWEAAAREHVNYVYATHCLNTDQAGWHDYYQETCRRRQALSYLADAYKYRRKGDDMSALSYLAWLYWLIGPEAYAVGWMPAPMPCLDAVWRAP